MNDHEAALVEAESPGLPSERMRELVFAAFDNSPVETAVERMLAETVAAKVLTRPDCPPDLLFLVATHPEWDTRFPGHVLRAAVLARPDCPDDIRVAAALADPLHAARGTA